MKKSFDLERFVKAQENIYDEVLVELRQKQKTGHWMWFIFPQIQGLGSSPMARTFAISSLQEASAYLNHPILGARLVECTQLVLLARDKPIHQMMGSPDDMKFRSSMTLFAHATNSNRVFVEAIETFFGGKFDDLTLTILDKLNEDR